MKKYLLLSILLVQALWLFGYEYQAVYSNRVCFFTNDFGRVETLLIDSTQMHQSDSFIYPRKNLKYDNSGCYNVNGSPWIGAKIIIKKDWNYFIAGNNDTVKLKTSAVLDEEFILFKSDSLTVNATLIKWDTLNVLDAVDSVKTFRLSVSDKLICPVLHPLEGKEIQVSKQHGIINSVHINLIPEFNLIESGQNPASKSFSLVGIENPARGVRNFTWKEANDFQQGDEFHYMDIQNYLSGGGSYTFKKRVKKILSRNTINDTIIYKVSYADETKYISVPKAEPQYSYQTYQRIEKYFTNDVFDGYPGIPYFNDSGCIIIDMGNNSKSLDSKSLSFSNDSIVCEPCDDVCGLSKVEKGLGLTFSSSGCGMETHEYKLVFYRKDNKEWGTPLTLVDPNYTPFPTENAQWDVFYKYTGWGPNTQRDSTLWQFSLSGDTVINGLTYSKLYTDKHGAKKWFGALREENRKIFYVGESYQSLLNYSNEILLYDFNALVGDTVWIDRGTDLYGTDLYYTIIEIDYVRIDGSNRKRYKVKNSFYDNEASYIVEGIGDINGGLLRMISPPIACTCSQTWNLICFSENGKTLYKNPDFVDCNSTQLWSEKKYLENNPVWTQYANNLSYIDLKTKYTIVGDTILNGITYKKIYETSNKSSFVSYYAAIREENGKFYARHPFLEDFAGVDTEFLIYDFSLNVGDTLNLTLFYGHKLDLPVTIVRIDTVTLLNGEKRKEFLTDLSPFGVPFSYIEGIGNSTGLFEPFYPITTGGRRSYLVCFKSNNETLFLNPDFCSSGGDSCCDLTSGISNKAQHTFTIYPNPTKDRFIVTLLSGYSSKINIRILNGMGKIFESIDFENMEAVNLSLENYHAGIYYVQIKVGDIMETYKIIKK